MATSLWLVILICLLIFSAIFSASETALTSVSYPRVRKIVNKKKKLKYLLHLKENQRKILISILIWNNLVNIAASSIAGALAYIIFGNLGIFITTFIMTFIIVTFGEILPKTYAIVKNENILKKFGKFIYFLHKIISPLSLTFNFLSEKLVGKEIKERYTKEEIIETIRLAEQQKLISSIERELIERIMELDKLTVNKIMIPKSDIVAVEESATIKDVLETFAKTKYSKIPVYKNNLNNIIGYVHIKDIIPLLLSSKENLDLNSSIKKVIREVIFVPETKKVIELIKEFRDKKHHIAIVVDEFGNVIGMVTLTDIFFEIFGKFKEVGEEREEDILITEKGYLVDASISISDLKEELGIEIPESDQYTTLAGFLLYICGYIPKKGEEIVYNGYKFIIEDADQKQIKLVRIIKFK